MSEKASINAVIDSSKGCYDISPELYKNMARCPGE
jgi:hypothetical protein